LKNYGGTGSRHGGAGRITPYLMLGTDNKWVCPYQILGFAVCTPVVTNCTSILTAKD